MTIYSIPGILLPAGLLRDHRAEQLQSAVHAVLGGRVGEGAPRLDQSVAQEWVPAVKLPR